MRRIVRTAVGLLLSLGLWTIVGAVAIRAQEQAAAVVGVKAGKAGTYHRPSCALLKRTPAKGRLDLADAEAAEADGLKPCAVCKPNADATAGKAAPAGKQGAGGGGKAISTAPGTVFSRDIAPIFVNNCYPCHEKAAAKTHQLELSSYSKVMKGSDTGPVVVAKKPAESELLLRVKGESTPKMPPGNNTLAPDTIRKLEDWIKGGAAIDAGYDADAALRSYAPTPDELRKAEVGRMSADQRDEVAEATGRARIKKAAGAADVEKHSSAHFVLLANLPNDRADALLKALERHHGQLKGLLGASPTSGLDGPIKIGVYVFRDAAPYAEFVRGVEGRELESGVQAHANFGAETPYVVAVDPLGGGDDPALNQPKKAVPRGKTKKDAKAEEPGGPDRSLEGLIAEQMAIGAATKAGKPPRWLPLGLGAYFAAQVDPRSRYARGLRAGAFQQGQVNWEAKVGDALRGETDPESIRSIGFSLFEWLGSTQRAQLPGFVRALEQEGGDKLDEVIKQGWGNATREQFVREWGNWVGDNYARTRG